MSLHSVLERFPCEVCQDETSGETGACTNGRCSRCHRKFCTGGGATSPGHYRRWPSMEEVVVRSFPHTCPYCLAAVQGMADLAATQKGCWICRNQYTARKEGGKVNEQS